MTDGTTTELIAEVRAELARQGRNAMELSQVTGITQTSLSRKLRGLNAFTVAELLTICDALGMTLADLASRTRRPLAEDVEAKSAAGAA